MPRNNEIVVRTVGIGSRVEIAYINPDNPMDDGRQEIIRLTEESEAATAAIDNSKKDRLVDSKSDLGRAVLGAHVAELRPFDGEVVEIIHIL